MQPRVHTNMGEASDRTGQSREQLSTSLACRITDMGYREEHIQPPRNSVDSRRNLGIARRECSDRGRSS